MVRKEKHHRFHNDIYCSMLLHKYNNYHKDKIKIHTLDVNKGTYKNNPDCTKEKKQFMQYYQRSIPQLKKNYRLIRTNYNNND